MTSVTANIIMPRVLYVYRARPLRVIDGDTIDIIIDMGLHAYRMERLRLLGVNAPEMHGATHDTGIAARDYVSNWLMMELDYQQDDLPLIIRTEKSDVFGRWLAVVWYGMSGLCLNDDLIGSGHAVPYMV
jgi:micrococcal nuclease